MKNLVIIRHAKSDWKNENLTDEERPLNKRGKRDAAFMAAALKKNDFLPDEIISSPALRALTTAQYFAKEFDFKKDEIQIEPALYSFNLFEVIEFLKTLNKDAKTVFVFSHNPTVTELVYFLTGKEIQMPTCSIAVIEIEKFAMLNSSCGKLSFHDFPKNHKELKKEVDD